MKNSIHLFRYLLRIHLSALLLMTILRIVFFLSAREQIGSDDLGHASYYLQAFVRGVWFDNVVACYILLVPLIFFAFAGQFRLRRRMVVASNIWFGVLYSIVFLACVGNIPYYAYFSKMLNAGIWNWAAYGGTTLGMIFGEASYYPYILLLVAIIVVWCMLLRRYGQSLYRETNNVNADNSPRFGQRIATAACFVALIALCVIGFRGRIGGRPIRVSAAYFCSNPVFNNLGLNAAFCLFNSSFYAMKPEHQRLNLMNDDTAITMTQSLLGRQGIEGISPIARQVNYEADSLRKAKNVVIVIMESMSAKLMSIVPDGRRLTPFLDSLFTRSMSFDNCYSAANHTNQGLYASLYSFPAIMSRNAMKGSNPQDYAGWPVILKEHGYSTLFFMTSDSEYDNMNAFFRTNGYDEIYSMENYPAEAAVNKYGVPDDFLFSYALPVLRERAAKGPFMATLLTISNHPPYVLPDDFKAHSDDTEFRIVEFADHCIAQFMAEAEKEDWACETIFVFVGDHGKLVGQSNLVLPECYNHVPLIFYGNGIAPEIHHDFACQIDIGPTILGMLGIGYTQNNFGLDLTRETRQVAFYTADKTIAARDTSALYVYDAEAEREYCYSLADAEPQLVDFSPKFQTLKDYVFAQLQCAEWIVGQGMTNNKAISAH